MKSRIFLLSVIAVIVAGCSPPSVPKQPVEAEGATRKADVPLASDLGKTESYFHGLYGYPKSENSVSNFTFMVPRHPSTVRVDHNFTIQNFENGRLKVKVLYSEADRRAVWVQYRLPSRWTKEQIEAALEAYGTNWKGVPWTWVMGIVMPAFAPQIYVTDDGVVAYKTAGNELMFYAPVLHSILESRIEQSKQEREAVPNF